MKSSLDSSPCPDPVSCCSAAFVVAALGLILLTAMSGCRRDATSDNEPSGLRDLDNPVWLASSDNSSDTTSVEQVPESSQSEPSETEQAPSLAADDGDRRTRRRRILLLLPGGPMIVDLQLSLDGQPIEKGIDSLIHRVLEAADTNQDGRSTWDELIQNDEFLAGPFGYRATENGPSAGADRQARQWKQRYDVDRNGRIDSREAQAWLGRDTGRAARPFDLRSSRSAFYDARANSPTWRLLDADEDDVLTAEEQEQATSRMLAHDSEDDYILRPRDLSALRDQIRAAEGDSLRYRPESDRHAALLLEPDGDWYRVLYLVGDLYAPRRNLGLGSFPLFPNLFDQLDADGDGRLDEDEIAALLTLSPHLKLDVDFSGDSATASGAKLGLSLLSPEIGSVHRLSPSRWILSLADVAVVFSANDMTPSDQRQTLGPTGAAATDPNQPASDPSDSAPSESDPPATMTNAASEAYSVARDEIRLMIHDRGDALFEHLDADHDGQLGEREILGAAGRLKSLDHDGRLTADELPRRWTVAFLRGEGRVERPFYIPVSARRTTTDSKAPRWFRRGDFNGDGQISRREFLGTSEQFQRLDHNDDGFLEADEVQAPANRNKKDR